MGWDAYAVTSNGKALFTYQDNLGLIIKDHVYARAFKNASDEVKKNAGTVDCLLTHGGLDVSTCAREMKRCTGVNAWQEDPVTPERVKALNLRMQESEPPLDSDKFWAYLSVKKFLEVCAEHNLGIHFSW